MTAVKGWFTYRDTTIHQHDDVGSVFRQLIRAVRPAQILEIGTSSGGLTLLVRDLLDEEGLATSVLRSYDILDCDRPALFDAILSGARIEFAVKNLFSHAYDELVEDEEVRELIQRPGTTMVLCDGGSKKNEVALLGRLLKQEDLILAHDYAPNETYFDEHIRGRVWDWMEIQDSDVQTATKELGLEPFMQEELQGVAWLCRRRS